MSEKAPFIPGWLDELPLSAHQMRVYVHLWRRGRTYSNAGTIATVCRMKRETVFAALKELEAMRLIRREPRPGQTTVIEPVPSNGTGKECYPSPETAHLPIPPNGTGEENPSPETARDPSPHSGHHPSPETGHKGTPSKVPPLRKNSTSKLSDAEFLESLRKDPAFEGLDIDRELERATAWIAKHPGRNLTRRFITSWLTRADRPLALATPKPEELQPEDRIGDRVGTFIPVE